MPTANLDTTTVTMSDVLIVGGGASAAILAAHFALRSHPHGTALGVTVIEPNEKIGPGLAYGQCLDEHVLNVSASNMSAWADDTDDFLRYCRQHVCPQTQPGAFMPRKVYGQYLHHLWCKAQRQHPQALHHVRTRVHALKRQINGVWAAHCADGRVLHARAAILAIGHESTDADFVLGAQQTQPNLKSPNEPLGLSSSQPPIISAWDFEHMQQLPLDARVLIVGSGLTAIDALLCLMPPKDQRMMQRHVQLISRHGLLPHAHSSQPQPLPAQPSQALINALLAAAPTVRARLRVLRSQLAHLQAQGWDWRDVLAALRAHTPQLWQDLSTSERRRFLRHLCTRWDVCRHRCAPTVAQRAQTLLGTGQVQLEAARLVNIAPAPYGHSAARTAQWVVELQARGAHLFKKHYVDALIVCTGPQSNIRNSHHAVLRQMQHDGLIRADALGLGLDFAPHTYTPISTQGTPTNGLWCLGPQLKASLWESIAIPELRGHAAAIAQAVCASLHNA